MRFETREITSIQFTDLVNTCRKNMHGLVDTVEKTLSQVNDTEQTELQHASALYSHAIEEYAHLMLLDTININNGMADLTPIEHKYFRHEEKFPMVFNELGQQGKTARKAPFDDNIFDSGIFDAKDTEISWDLRLRIFNTEVDSSGKPKLVPMISKNDLAQAVSTLKSARLY